MKFRVFLIFPSLKQRWHWNSTMLNESLIKIMFECSYCRGAVASWLVRSSPDRAVRLRALAGDTLLFSWARHFTLTVPLSTQEYKWVPANCWGNLTNCGGVTCDELASRPGGVEILLAASCYRNRGKFWQLRASRLQGFTFKCSY